MDNIGTPLQVRCAVYPMDALFVNRYSSLRLFLVVICLPYTIGNRNHIKPNCEFYILAHLNSRLFLYEDIYC